MASSLSDAEKSSTEKPKPSSSVRVVIQQCLSARLQVKPPSAEGADDAEFVEIGRGEILYVCFYSSASEEDAIKAANSCLKARLCEVPAASKKVSVVESRGDVLIVPQATLGGTMKGRAFQYHRNISPDLGRSLYETFVSVVQREVHSQGTPEQSAGSVQAGTYGNRQVLSMVTNGPSTHIIEWSGQPQLWKGWFASRRELATVIFQAIRSPWSQLPAICDIQEVTKNLRVAQSRNVLCEVRDWRDFWIKFCTYITVDTSTAEVVKKKLTNKDNHREMKYCLTAIGHSMTLDPIWIHVSDNQIGIILRCADIYVWCIIYQVFPWTYDSLFMRPMHILCNCCFNIYDIPWSMWTCNVDNSLDSFMTDIRSVYCVKSCIKATEDYKPHFLETQVAHKPHSNTRSCGLEMAAQYRPWGKVYRFLHTVC